MTVFWDILSVLIGIGALFVFYCFLRDVIVPKYLLRKHRVTFDVLLDGYKCFEIAEALRPFHIIGNYSETEDGVGIVTVWLPIWKERKFLANLRRLENVEVI